METRNERGREQANIDLCAPSLKWWLAEVACSTFRETQTTGNKMEVQSRSRRSRSFYSVSIEQEQALTECDAFLTARSSSDLCFQVLNQKLVLNAPS